MSLTNEEALASLRILVAIAQADGTVHDDEKRSLLAAISTLSLGLDIDKVLGEKVDLDAQLEELKSNEAKEQAFRSAYFMAHADGNCSAEEAALLDRIAEKTGTTEHQRAALSRLFVGRAKGGEAMSLSPIAPITDAAERNAEVKKRALRYAVLTAALGAFPIPGLAIATDLAVVGVQLKMIRDVGALWGHTVNKEAAKSLLYGVGLGTGARLAVNNLAKLLPGWGSVIGATTSFVSTYALANVIDKLFADGIDVTKAKPSDLKPRFKVAEDIAKGVYADHEEVVIASMRMNHSTFDQLSHQLSEGLITQEEFDAKVAALAT